MKRQEIYALTGLRGIAALVIMLFHFQTSKFLTGPVQLMMQHGYLMVDLFLILSGFIIAMVYGQRFSKPFNLKDYHGFMLRRIARMWPLYVLMTVTAGILTATGWMDHWAGPGIPISTVVDFTGLQGLVHVPTLDTPGWSVSAEWIVNLIFPFLALFCLRRSWFNVAIVALIALITLPVIVALPAVAHEPHRGGGLLNLWHYATVYPIVRCLADFMLGMVVFRLSELSWVQRVTAFKGLALLLLIAILYLMALKQPDLWIV